MGRMWGTGEDSCEIRRQHAEANMTWRRLQLPMRPPPWQSDGVVPAALPVLGGLALAFAALACLAGVLVGLALARGREDPVRRATTASLAGDLEEALRWLRRARQQAPADAGLALEEAWHLSALGRTEEALAVYDEIEPRLPAGQAAWLKAVALLEHGGDLDEVERLAVTALRLAPVLAEEARLEPDLLRRMKGRPAFERALRDAESALGED